MSEVPLSVMQNSFAAGEVSPTLFGRVDLESYHIGLQKALNMFVDYRGGISNRPGTRLVGLCINSNVANRLIPFTYSNVQTYVLVFSELTMRVIKNGGYVVEPAVTITARDGGGGYTSVGHGYAVGDWVSLSDKEHPALISSVSTNTFALVSVYDGTTPVISTSTTAARIYTLVTPWHAADLATLKFTQSFDTMTLTHPNYQSYNLTRSQHWVWTLTAINPASAIGSPTISGVSVTTSGTVDFSQANCGYGYRITAINAAGEEGNPSPLVSFQSYDMETFHATYTVNWTPVSGAISYNVYRTTVAAGAAVDSGAPTGYIGYATDTTFQDSNIIPDFTKTPPTHQNPFAASNYPAVVTYFDQRKTYAGSNANPQTLWFSRPGQYNNFDTSTPANDGDALTYTLSTTQSSFIKALLPMPDGLIAFTQSGIHRISGGGQYTGIKVSSAVARQQNYIGIGDVPPIPLNYEILFVQQKGSLVRNLTYNFYTSTYEPADLTVLSNHLFTSPIVEWAWAEHPYKLVWAVRADGQALTLTYLKEQKLQGWTQHSTGGDFLSVASVNENNTDSVYFVVARNINGRVFRFIEQLQSKDLPNGIQDSWYLDCALDYTGAPVTTVSGLDHLANTSVSVLADGNPVSGTVSATGTLTLTTAASRVIVGLPYAMQCQTLDLEPSSQSQQGKRKRVVALTAKVYNTPALQYGPNFDELTFWNDNNSVLVNGLMTGDQSLGVNQYYDLGGRVCWQQPFPLPMTVLSLVAELSTGD